jgi:heme exporter protein A
MLTASHLACLRGERRLFADISFSLAAGEWLHVQGENGAGKTSLLRVLVGLSPAAEGQIYWRGALVGGVAAASAAADFRRDMLYMGHHAAVKDELNALENLQLSAAIDGFHLSESAALSALARLGLRGREALPVRVLSAGQKRRVLLARLITRPAALWVLDEAFNALDSGAVQLLGDLVSGHLAQGGLAVLTSHQALPLPGGQRLVL